MPVVYIGTYNLEYAWGGRAKLERDGSMTIVSREGNNIYSLLRYFKVTEAEMERLHKLEIEWFRHFNAARGAYDGRQAAANDAHRAAPEAVIAEGEHLTAHAVNNQY